MARSTRRREPSAAYGYPRRSSLAQTQKLRIPSGKFHGSSKQGQSSFNRVTGLLFLTDHPHEHLTVSEALVLKARRLAPDHPWAHFTLAMLEFSKPATTSVSNSLLLKIAFGDLGLIAR
ncbi:hypothetical protein E4K64_30365 [Bradyrhizobium frederickii]|uniref:Uncharacterized protein n=1 Tax=Bradyrhizobium frederickii TaxID=2560054 RepID=A0A4Y9NRJ1_9BRAD|nr:hypothetical protein E4K64_30365 [Bradyrhizobium frederickii]